MGAPFDRLLKVFDDLPAEDLMNVVLSEKLQTVQAAPPPPDPPDPMEVIAKALKVIHQAPIIVEFRMQESVLDFIRSGITPRPLSDVPVWLPQATEQIQHVPVYVDTEIPDHTIRAVYSNGAIKDIKA